MVFVTFLSNNQPCDVDFRTHMISDDDDDQELYTWHYPYSPLSVDRGMLSDMFPEHPHLIIGCEGEISSGDRHAVCSSEIDEMIEMMCAFYAFRHWDITSPPRVTVDCRPVVDGAAEYKSRVIDMSCHDAYYYIRGLTFLRDERNRPLLSFSKLPTALQSPSIDDITQERTAIEFQRDVIKRAYEVKHANDNAPDAE